MRFLTMVTTTNPETAGPPPPALYGAIDELGKAAGAALKESGGMRDVALAKVENRDVVLDGPYAESKEVVGGFAIYELPDAAAVMDYTRQFLDLHRKHWPQWEGTVTIQQLVPMG